MTAVPAVPGGPGSDQVYSITNAYVSGTLFQHTDLAYSQGGSTIGYRQNILAANGETSYVSTVGLDTRNATAATPNLATQTALTYNAAGDGTPGGSMMFDEAGAVSAYGESTASSSLSCPIGASSSGGPAYSAQVVAGSSMIGVTEVALNTQTTASITGAGSSVPVTLTYQVDAQGIPGVGNDTLAEGTATVYMTATITGGAGNGTVPASDISYNDVTNVNGLFDLAKQMAYTSSS